MSPIKQKAKFNRDFEPYWIQHYGCVRAHLGDGEPMNSTDLRRRLLSCGSEVLLLILLLGFLSPFLAKGLLVMGEQQDVCLSVLRLHT